MDVDMNRSQTVLVEAVFRWSLADHRLLSAGELNLAKDCQVAE
jgi:hypothetical protein